MKYIILIGILVLMLSGCAIEYRNPPNGVEGFDTFIWERCEDNIICISTYARKEMSHCFIDNEKLIEKYCKEEYKNE